MIYLISASGRYWQTESAEAAVSMVEFGGMIYDPDQHTN
jgi:hypothetical protein